MQIMLSIHLNSSTCIYLSLDNGVTMTSKRRENKNLVRFIRFSFLVINSQCDWNVRPFQLIINEQRSLTRDTSRGLINRCNKTSLLGIFTVTFFPGIDAVKFHFTTLKFFDKYSLEVNSKNNL